MVCILQLIAHLEEHTARAGPTLRPKGVVVREDAEAEAGSELGAEAKGGTDSDKRAE